MHVLDIFHAGKTTTSFTIRTVLIIPNIKNSSLILAAL